MTFIHIDPPPDPKDIPEYLSRMFQELEAALTQEKTFPGLQTWDVCVGTPEGQISAPVGSIRLRTDGGAGTTLYVKESGTGNTGWIAK